MAQQSTIGRTATTVSKGVDGATRVTYHWTDVVTVYPNGKIVLDTGGYFTSTTKTRMNQASSQLDLGFRVRQENYAWFVDIDGHTLEFGRGPLTIRNGLDIALDPSSPFGFRAVS